MQRFSKSLCFLFAFSLLSINLIAQDNDPRKIWATLGHVTFNGGNDVLTMNMAPPTYSQDILALDGKEIIIKGYVIPMDFGGNYVVISSSPFATCFFCGGAGPETVMEVYLQSPKKIKSEQLTVKGRLQLNKGEMEHLTYMLKNAVIVEE